MNANNTSSEVNRRDFLRGGSLATFMMLMGGVPIRAEDSASPDKEGDGTTDYQGLVTPVNMAVIGCGVWGRELLKTLARVPAGPVVALCDTYAPYLKRAAELAPNAQRHTDYRQLLEQKEVQAVVVATPSHQHRQVVLDALQAGKHVYCEAPLATSLEDARAIAQAANHAYRCNFQAGLTNRADPQRYYLVRFVRTGAMGRTISGRAQWHKKQSWRLTSPNPDREQEINWRLRRDSSVGLVGELGIHSVDLANWFMMNHPVAVSGRGELMQWKDGRQMPDNVQTVFEYPGGELFTCACSLATSFDADYELFFGTHSTIMCRERRAWMFKEVDSPLLGWEVYARKDAFYKESGIVLDANSTKQTAHNKGKVGDPLADDETSLHYALKAFATNSGLVQSGIENFTASYDANDVEGLKEYLGTLRKSRIPAAGPKEGYEATVCVIKANEAVLRGGRIVFEKDWFELG